LLGRSKKTDISNAEIMPSSTYDIEYIEERFLYHARRVWGDNIDTISFKFEFKKQKSPMSIAYKARPQAIQNALVSVPKDITLYISEDFFSYSEEDREKIIIHEVIHIGYTGHGEKFLTQVKKFGGVRSITELEDLGIKLQSKLRSDKRGRFKTVQTFGTDDLNEAREQMYKYATHHQDEKVRLIF